MKQQKKWYSYINICVLLISIFFLAVTNVGAGKLQIRNSGWMLAVMAGIAIIVHVLKVLRLYLILYGSGVSLVEHLKQYCKVIPVSMILPFKLGEIFRIYCYGYQLKNYFLGIVVILLDRFMDTVALVILIFFFNVISGSNFTFLFYVLVAFLIGLMICYAIFPGISHYWKQYFLRAKATKENIRLLNIMEKTDETYREVAALLKGRSAIICLLSFVAWITEISGLFLCNSILGDLQSTMLVSEYLSAVLLGDKSVYLQQFILISIVLMLALYLIVRHISLYMEKEGEKC